MQETLVRFMGWGDPLEKGKATHSSIWPGELHGLYNPWVTKDWTGLSDFHFHWASHVAQLVKNLPAMQETWVLSPDWGDPLEKGKATHSSILARRITWTV